MIRREKLIAVISSEDLRFGSGDGCALVVTDARIVGARRGEDSGVSDPYLWSATGSSQEDAAAAEKAAAEFIDRKQFSFSKEGVFKILYEPPGLFFGGRVAFDSVGERVQLDLSVVSVWNPGSLLTVRKLVGALLAFSPDKLYDEKTGALVRDESSGPRRAPATGQRLRLRPGSERPSFTQKSL